jgi:hypothetical protein
MTTTSVLAAGTGNTPSPRSRNDAKTTSGREAGTVGNVSGFRVGQGTEKVGFFSIFFFIFEILVF